MIEKIHAVFLVGCLSIASLVPAATTVAEPQSILLCHSPVATREIRIYHTGNGGCRVDYLKEGATRTLWSASSDHGYCQTRATALAATLARGNFTCDATDHMAANDKSPLTETQISAANQWLRQRVESLMKNQPAQSEAETKRYSASPDFLTAADVDADGRTDLVLGWNWATFRCDGANLTVLINDGSDLKPVYRPADIELPGNCGAKGWLASVKDVKAQRIYINLQQRFPGTDNVKKISATLRHDGTFTFFGPTGSMGSLAAIEKALSLQSE